MIIFISIILIHILILTGPGYFIFLVKKIRKRKILVMVLIVQIETIILYSKEASRQLLYPDVVALQSLQKRNDELEREERKKGGV
ncbi:hypothetical protein HanIR_Chr01g0035901 [Helianthus annuus]|nr:hypothetical protein HanIR_Chr01g0035901 [Helianthus annuus]